MVVVQSFYNNACPIRGGWFFSADKLLGLKSCVLGEGEKEQSSVVRVE